jgi:hypothetical protein
MKSILEWFKRVILGHKKLTYMDEPIHIRLLKELESNGLNPIVNISPFLKENFIKPTISNVQKYNREIKSQLSFVLDLVERGLITFYRKEEPTFWGNTIFKTGAKPTAIWFDDETLAIDTLVTTKGLEFLENYKLVQSNFSVNDASINNYKSQKYFSIAIVVLAFSSALIALFTYLRDNDVKTKEVVLQMQIDSLKKEIMLKKTLQTPLLNPKKALLDSCHKH